MGEFFYPAAAAGAMRVAEAAGTETAIEAAGTETAGARAIAVASRQHGQQRGQRVSGGSEDRAAAPSS